jgi:hypothetical protein
MAEEQSVEQPILVPVDLRDASLAVQVVDLAAERGGFKGPELEIIGQFRGRLANLVQQYRPQEEEAPAEEGAEG